MIRTALGICGWKNSGKTTLIESLVPLLKDKGLSVAVIKHDAHGLQVDHPGKDSDRFFRAGADVLLQGPEEEVLRRSLHGPPALESALARLSPCYDLILVEGHKKTSLPKVWLHGDGDSPPAEGVEDILLELPFSADRTSRVMAFIMEWLKTRQAAIPVFGCVLIGGQSRRMGTPKHLLLLEGETWIERVVKKLSEAAAEVVVAGVGRLPDPLADLKRIPDAPGVEGPMSGLLACMRWNPEAAWLAAPCDMPEISTEALEWLLSQREPGVWAVQPRLRADGAEIQPLLAYYDFRCRTLLEEAARSEDFCLYHLARDARVRTPEPPARVEEAWKNINTAEDLDRFRSP